jgi:hypothetical protein
MIEDESLGMLHREGDDVEGEVEENWGSKKDEYKRTKGHKSGDVDGHYKDYEMENELFGPAFNLLVSSISPSIS